MKIAKGKVGQWDDSVHTDAYHQAWWQVQFPQPMWLRDAVSTDCPLTSMCASMRVYILIHKQIIKHYFKKELVENYKLRKSRFTAWVSQLNHFLHSTQNSSTAIFFCGGRCPPLWYFHSYRELLIFIDNLHYVWVSSLEIHSCYISNWVWI